MSGVLVLGQDPLVRTPPGPGPHPLQSLGRPVATATAERPGLRRAGVAAGFRDAVIRRVPRRGQGHRRGVAGPRGRDGSAARDRRGHVSFLDRALPRRRSRPDARGRRRGHRARRGRAGAGVRILLSIACRRARQGPRRTRRLRHADRALERAWRGARTADRLRARDLRDQPRRDVGRRRLRRPAVDRHRPGRRGRQRRREPGRYAALSTEDSQHRRRRDDQRHREPAARSRIRRWWPAR